MFPCIVLSFCQNVKLHPVGSQTKTGSSKPNNEKQSIWIPAYPECITLSFCKVNKAVEVT